MKEKMTLNRRLIYQVYQNIKARPESFDMAGWGRNGICGTVACFAGHVTLIDGSGYYYKDTLCNTINSEEEAYFNSELVGKTLGLPHSTLFHVLGWPQHIEKTYDANPIEALRQAIIYFTQYDPESSLEQGDSLPEGKIVLSISLQEEV